MRQHMIFCSAAFTALLAGCSAMGSSNPEDMVGELGAGYYEQDISVPSLTVSTMASGQTEMAREILQQEVRRSSGIEKIKNFCVATDQPQMIDMGDFVKKLSRGVAMQCEIVAREKNGANFNHELSCTDSKGDITSLDMHGTKRDDGYSVSVRISKYEEAIQDNLHFIVRQTVQKIGEC